MIRIGQVSAFATMKKDPPEKSNECDGIERIKNTIIKGSKEKPEILCICVISIHLICDVNILIINVFSFLYFSIPKFWACCWIFFFVSFVCCCCFFFCQQTLSSVIACTSHALCYCFGHAKDAPKNSDRVKGTEDRVREREGKNKLNN